MLLRDCLPVPHPSKRSAFQQHHLTVSLLIHSSIGSARKRTVIGIHSRFVAATVGHGFRHLHGEIKRTLKKNSGQNILFFLCFRASLRFLCGVLPTIHCFPCIFQSECPLLPWFDCFQFVSSRPSSTVLIHFWRTALSFNQNWPI